MKTNSKNQKVGAMGGMVLGSIGLGTTFLATSTDFLVAALLVVIGLGLVIYTMMSKHKFKLH